jgi:hypothetical protein
MPRSDLAPLAPCKDAYNIPSDEMPEIRRNR